MTDRIRLALQFDAAAMRGDLAQLVSSDWVDHFVTQNYEGTWTVLPLRAPAGATHPVKMIYSDPACTSFVDTPLLAKCPVFQQVLAAFECPLQAVRLMKLAPGSEIKPHRDLDLSLEHGRARLHIPVATNEEVDFVLNGARVVLREGECWYLRLSDTHSVANRGATDRIHLVIDALVNPWLEAQLTMENKGHAEGSSADGSDLDRFRDLVLHDPPLQRQLALLEDRDAFIAGAIDAAAARGCRVTAAEIDAAMQDARRRWRVGPA